MLRALILFGALQASAQLLLSGFVGASSGVLAKALGYEGLFVGAGVLGGRADACAPYSRLRTVRPDQGAILRGMLRDQSQALVGAGSLRP